MTEAELKSSFLFLRFLAFQKSRQAPSEGKLVGKEGRQVVPRALPLPISHEALLFYPSWGHAHLREGGPQETRMLLGGKWSGCECSGCSGISHRQLELEVARGPGVSGAFVASLLAPPLELWERLQLPPLRPSCQDAGV